MTVSELIAHLSQFDGNLPVELMVYSCGETSYIPTYPCTFSEDRNFQNQSIVRIDAEWN